MVALLLASTLSACAPANRAIVTEVYYDAPGDDTGHEFVELWNPGALPVSLEGVRLEAGDGSAVNRWTLRWTGNAAQLIAPGERFVVGGARVSPPPDATVTLDLQNGPDAVRLVWLDGVRETVGWGMHEFAEYACVAPALDAPSGQSLSRVPDDADLGSNALDFRPAPPSPRRANQARRDLALASGSFLASTPRPDANRDFRLQARLVNAGRDTLGAREARLVVRCDAWTLPREVAVTDPLEPGDSLAVYLDAELPAGRWRLNAEALAAGDANRANDLDSLTLRSGDPPLRIEEIQFHPADGAGEWVEVRNASGALLDLADWTLGERSGARGRVRAFAPLPSESLAVFAQDRAALLARHRSLDTTRVLEVTPWGALNNSDDATGIADVITLREPDGTFADAVAYRASGVPAGAAIVREGDAWRASSPPEGTPLAPSAPLPAIAGRFAIERPRVREGETAVFAWRLPWERPRVSLELFDLTGRRARRLLDDVSVAARDVRTSSLGGVPPGLYVAVLRAREGGGRESLVLSCALRVVRGGS